MSDWRVPVQDLVQLLEDRGLSVEMGHRPPGRDLRATGDRGAMHVEVALDAAGRVRLTTTWLQDDQAMEPLAVNHQRFSRVRSTEERVTVAGEVASIAALRELLDLLGIYPPC